MEFSNVMINNELVKFNNSGKTLDLFEGFKKGKNSLNAYELEEVGDVKGKKLLHLQCHFGQDTLSWSRLGAKCTGIDLSNEGIELAKKLNLTFGCSDFQVTVLTSGQTLK